MPLVLGASSDPFSAEHTGKVLKVFFGWMQPEPFGLLHFMIRKLAHLSEYGILAFLFFRAWRGARSGTLPGMIGRRRHGTQSRALDALHIT